MDTKFADICGHYSLIIDLLEPCAIPLIEYADI